MQELIPYFQLLSSFDATASEVPIDLCHNMFLIGALVAKKPKDVLEIGIGSGYVTISIIHALRYNGVGKLTSLDNWEQWQGVEPPGAEGLRKAGVTLVAPMDEEKFVRHCPTDSYDVLISDGDHLRSGSWIDEHLRIVRHDGFMFFHDTNQPDAFPSLQLVGKRLKELSIPHYHFTTSSRPDERCERGLLFAINRK